VSVTSTSQSNRRTRQAQETQAPCPHPERPATVTVELPPDLAAYVAEHGDELRETVRKAADEMHHQARWRADEREALAVSARQNRKAWDAIGRAVEAELRRRQLTGKARLAALRELAAQHGVSTDHLRNILKLRQAGRRELAAERYRPILAPLLSQISPAASVRLPSVAPIPRERIKPVIPPGTCWQMMDHAARQAYFRRAARIAFRLLRKGGVGIDRPSGVAVDPASVVAAVARGFDVPEATIDNHLAVYRRRVDARLASRRDRLAWQLACQGWANARIGKRVGVSPGHVTRIIRRCVADGWKIIGATP
jgi:hypothetical protein